jgi:hypothetical protein
LHETLLPIHFFAQHSSKQVMSLPCKNYLGKCSIALIFVNPHASGSAASGYPCSKTNPIYSWLPRQPINPTHYFTKKLHPDDSPQICMASHCCQLITSHWTSVSDQQKEEMRRQRWRFPSKDFKVQQPLKKIEQQFITLFRG